MIITKISDKVYPWGIKDEDEVIIAKVLTKDEANSFIKTYEMYELLLKIRDEWSAHMEKLPAEYMINSINKVIS